MNPLPSLERIKVKKLTYETKGRGGLVVLDEDGKIYAGTIHNRVFYPFGYDLDSLLRAIARLGAINRRDAEQHIKLCRVAAEKRERIGEVNHFVGCAKELGITLSRQQRKQLELYRA